MSLFSRLRISWKLPIALVFLASVLAATIVAFADSRIRNAVVGSGMERLLAVAESRSTEMSREFQNVMKDLSAQSVDPVAVDALLDFRSAWSLAGPEGQRVLRAHFQTGAGQSSGADARVGAQAYFVAHDAFHQHFEAVQRARGYRDVLLLDPEGQVVYSVQKGADFGAQIRDGAFAGSPFGRGFELARRGAGFTREVVTEIEPYAGADGEPSFFAIISVVSEEGRRDGFLAFRLNTSTLSQIAGRQTGLGSSGEVFVVGEDRLVRTDLRRTEADDVLQTRTNTLAVTAALNGQSGVASLGSSAGDVLTAYAPLRFHKLTYAVIAEQPLAEVLAPAIELRAALIRNALIASAALSLIGIVMARSVTVPLSGIGRAIRNLSEGDFDGQVPGHLRTDEIGVIARQVDVFRASMLEMEAVTRENAFKSLAYQSASAALMLADADFTVIHVNDRLKGLFETHRGSFDRFLRPLEPGTLAGRDVTTIFHGMARAAEALGQGKASVFTDEIRLGLVRLHVAVGLVRDGAGQAIGYVLEFADVTSERMDRGVLDALDAAHMTAQISQGGRIITANAAFCRAIGRRTEELLGRPWSDTGLGQRGMGPSSEWSEMPHERWFEFQTNGSQSGIVQGFGYVHAACTRGGSVDFWLFMAVPIDLLDDPNPSLVSAPVLRDAL